MDFLPEQIGPAALAVAGLILAIILNVAGFDFTTSSFHGYSGSADKQEPVLNSPVPTEALIVKIGDNLMVNGIRIGQNISDIRTQVGDFPSEGTNVSQEDGWIRQAATYQDATYYFDGKGVLHRIGIKNTPETINYNSTYQDAVRAYGNPIYAFCSANSTDAPDLTVAANTNQCQSYAVFNAYPTNKLVWVMSYDRNTNKIQTIALDDGLDYYTNHARNAGQA
ncbi:MAG: hypothetical protein Q3962_02045 [Corynebacterium sp.]|nr:hypothetical protein [Corynebacterium sp.]